MLLKKNLTESLLFIEARVKAGAVEKEKNPAPDKNGPAPQHLLTPVYVNINNLKILSDSRLRIC